MRNQNWSLMNYVTVLGECDRGFGCDNTKALVIKSELIEGSRIIKIVENCMTTIMDDFFYNNR
jgi:hypothetical protein